MLYRVDRQKSSLKFHKKSHFAYDVENSSKVSISRNAVMPQKNTSQRGSESGTLYIVATPIGNIDDMSFRAVDILKSVVQIAAEDTRHSARLCQHYGIKTPMISLHEHNELARLEQIEQQLQQGSDLALISDAGTPLISDPGYKIVRELRQKGYKISPVPGASAIISALSIAGIATDSFSFFGFLPAKSSGRKQKFETLKYRQETLVFYESSHRIEACLQDAKDSFATRKVALCRELTKTFETVLYGSVEEVLEQVSNDSDQRKGEFVLLFEGATESPEESTVDSEALLKALLQELPPNKAAKIAAKITGLKKQQLYQIALDLKS